MKPFRILALIAALFVLSPALFAAEFGLRAGHYSDLNEDFVGAEMVFDIGALNINPNIEYVLDDDDTTSGSANLDVTFNIGQFSRVSPYVGAGLGLWYVDDDLGDNTSETLGNVIGGVQFDFDFLKPYAQVKYSRFLDEDGGGDNDELAWTIGLRF